MTNTKRELCRKVSAFLSADVTKKGNAKFKNSQFSFKDLVTVERDDRIRNEKNKSVTKIAEDEKMSRNQVYKILRRK